MSEDQAVILAEDDKKAEAPSPIVASTSEDKVQDETEKLLEVEAPSPQDETKMADAPKSHLGNLIISDDSTLPNPSSGVMLRGKQTHIFSTELKQLVLERDGDGDVVKAKQFDETTPGLLLLRGAYTLIAVLMSGFLFVFSVQVILFLFLGLAIESGLTAKQSLDFPLFLGILVSIPAFLLGLANAMTIAMAFVADTWNGNKFMKTVTKWDSVLVDWVSCAIYILIPLITGGVSLSSGSALWWEHTCLAWIIGVFVFYLVFVCVTIFFEIDGCLELIHARTDLPKYSLDTVKNAILLKQKSMLSGTKTFSYIIDGSDSLQADFEEAQDMHERQKERCEAPSIGFLSHITVLFAGGGCTYDKLATPKRIYSVDEVRGYTPFITRNTWGLEKIYCRNREASMIAIIRGEASLTGQQATSSFVCYIFGVIITLFLIIAALAWFETSPTFIGVASGLYILFMFNQTRNSLALKKIHSRLYNDTKKSDDANEAITHVRSKFRITEPKDVACWSIFGLEILFFFMAPLIALFMSGNIPVGIVFIVVVLVTGARRFMSATVCFEEFGTLDGIEENNKGIECSNKGKACSIEVAQAEWREKHRLEMIVSQISHGSKKEFWINVFAFFIIIFCAIFMSAVALGTDEGTSDTLTMSDNFEYPGSGNLKYASCELGQGIVTPAGTDRSLADFTFLSFLAYRSPTVTGELLDDWFKANSDMKVIDHQDIVDLFKVNDEKQYGKSPVAYKFLGFPSRGVGVVAIRGTSNSWDALTDAQLWSSATLAQWIRAALPLGNLLSPILKYLVEVVSWIEASGLQEVSYYMETRRFVEFIQKEGYYNDIVVTGHSLGGGLAMITGAQTKVPSVGVSGPNAMISRLTFNPPIEEEDLEKYTFNIVPDRDPVPRFDDLSQNYQRINCRAAPNNPIDCHTITRSLCEILYTCGSEGRPIPCACVQQFNYTTPEIIDASKGTFEEICPAT